MCISEKKTILGLMEIGSGKKMLTAHLVLKVCRDPGHHTDEMLLVRTIAKKITFKLAVMFTVLLMFCSDNVPGVESFFPRIYLF